jgi:predicted dehydrogenase
MIRIGIIGTGGMAQAHANEFSRIKGVKIVACSDVVEERVRAFAAKNLIVSTYTDYREMLTREELHGVSNVTPDRFHAEISLAVIQSGVAILCEKPMATSLKDAVRMRDAAVKAGIINMVNFSYRNSSALQAAAAKVKSGSIGAIRHVEASYLQSWLVSKVWGDWRKSPALIWRLSTKHGSGGDLGDIGCHIYDMASFLCGDITEIYCKLETFDKGIPGNAMGEYVFDANDSFASTVTFENGALGTIHSSRWATGHANSLRIRAYGDKGAIEIDLDRSYDEYRICSGKDIDSASWKTVTTKSTPNNYQRFIRSIKTGKNDASDFENGLKVQAYLDGSVVSAKRGKPVRVAQSSS